MISKKAMHYMSSDVSGLIIGERYIVSHALGAGGMGTVLAAYDPDTQQDVAIKMLSVEGAAIEDENLILRMQREVHVLSEIDSPYIIQFLDSGFDAQHGWFYVMEWLKDSLPLELFLQQHTPLCFERLKLWRDILRGLNVLHAHHVVHRDLKPSNILCFLASDTLHVKLIDLGIACWFSDVIRTQITVETEPGTVLGSPAYMAPEMWRSEPVDARTDIYQVGAVGYTIFAGEPPFSGSSHQLMFQHLHAFPKPLYELDVKLPTPVPSVHMECIDSWIQRAMHKDPDARFQTVSEFLHTLDAYIDRYTDCIGTQDRSVASATSDSLEVDRGVLTFDAKTSQPPSRFYAAIVGAVALVIWALWGWFSQDLFVAPQNLKSGTQRVQDAASFSMQKKKSVQRKKRVTQKQQRSQAKSALSTVSKSLLPRPKTRSAQRDTVSSVRAAHSSRTPRRKKNVRKKRTSRARLKRPSFTDTLMVP